MSNTVVYKANPVISFKDEGEEGAVLYNPDTDKAIIINSVGAAIWRFIESPHSFKEIASMLVNNFSGVDIEQAQKDVDQFISSFEKGFIDEIS